MRWIRLILFLYLLAASAEDLKSRTVSLPMAFAAGIAACVLRAACGDGFLLWAAGCLPGVFLIAAAYATRQAIGYGDGCVVIVIGLFLGCAAAVEILTTALLLLCPVSLIFLMWKQNRKYTLPLAPFLWAAYVIWWILMNGNNAAA